MPHTISYSNLCNVLPQQRLLMYEKVFNTTDPLELHGAYIWSIKLAASIYPLLSTLEVALRNSIHTTATQLIGVDWYDKLATKVRTQYQSPQRDQSNIDWHNKQIADIKKKIKRKTPARGLNKHDLLVAKMDFGFWDNLLRECFLVNGNPMALWPRCTPIVFPNLPSGYTNKNAHDEISELRELRNDIAHHSPIWKNRTVHDKLTAITYINQRINKIVEVIGWLSRDKVNWIEVHMLVAEARRVASINYLELCQRKDMNHVEVKFSCFRRELKKQFKILNINEFKVINNSSSLFLITKIST